MSKLHKKLFSNEKLEYYVYLIFSIVCIGASLVGAILDNVWICIAAAGIWFLVTLILLAIQNLCIKIMMDLNEHLRDMSFDDFDESTTLAWPKVKPETGAEGEEDPTKSKK